MMNHTRKLIWIPVAFALSGCGSGLRCDQSVCGTIIVAQGTDAETLFPPLMQNLNAFAIGDLIYLKLASLNSRMNTVGDTDFIPQLAESWRRIDPVTLRFAIDPRARWHDGNPVSARDVEFTFSVYTDSLVASPRASLISRISRVAAIASDTVEFRFESPYPEQVYDAVHHMRILPAHLMDTIPRARLGAHPINRSPVGSGPFEFDRWEVDQFLTLTADTAFFLGRPGVRRIIWRVTPDKEAAISQLVAGEADLVENLRTAVNIERAARQSHLQLVEYPTTSYMYLQFNVRNPTDHSQAHPLFGSRDLRRALSMIVDRETVKEAVFGDYGETAVAPVSQTLSIWSPDLPRLDFDPARAVALLDSLGWVDSDDDGIRDRDGEPLSFELTSPSTDNNRHSAAVIIQEQLRQAGVEMRISEPELNTLIARVTGGEFDVFFGFRGQDPTPSTIREAWGSSGIGGSNFGGYSNATFDRFMDEAIAEFDPERAGELWLSAITEIVADAPAIWLFSPKSVLAAHSRITNITVQPEQWAATMWTWTVTDGELIDRDLAGD